MSQVWKSLCGVTRKGGLSICESQSDFSKNISPGVTGFRGQASECLVLQEQVFGKLFMHSVSE